MEIRQLITFKAVADRLSFNKAARDIHYAQSTVSAQISSLEEELGCRLFDRLGKRIIMTDAGRNLYDYACRIIDLSEAARQEIADNKEASGVLTIRVPESFVAGYLPPVIAAFRCKAPGVGLKFVTCSHEGLQQDLQKGVVDLGFLLTDSIQAADLESEILFIENLVLVGSPGHPLAEKKNFSTADLEGSTLLLTNVDCSYRRILEGMLRQCGCKPDRVIEFSSVRAAVACAAAGVGLTLVPQITVWPEIERGDLIILPWLEHPLETACLMIRHADKWLSPALQGFMEVVRGNFHRDK